MNDKWVVKKRSIEEQFHDLRASNLGEDALYASGILRYADEYALGLLGDVNGKVLVDAGCGAGANAVCFAQTGAKVFAFDISIGMLEATRRLAQENGVLARVNVVKMAAEDLAYPSGFADLVFGHSILHHTDLALTRQEVHRILRPGGRAVFLEPLGHHPLIRVFRWLTPSRRTPTEKPLRFEDALFFAEPFSSFCHREFYLVTPAAFAFLPFGSRKLFRAVLDILGRADNAVLARWPGLGKYAWVIVMGLVK